MPVKKSDKKQVDAGIIPVKAQEKPVVSTKKNTGINELDELADLETGHMVALFRTLPRGNGLHGFIEDLPVPPQGIEGIQDYIKQRYGGGTFRIQAKNSNHSKFGKGVATLEISGIPLSNDGQREWDGARFIPRSFAPQVVPAPYGAPYPPPGHAPLNVHSTQSAPVAVPNNNADVNAHLFRLVGDLLKNREGGGNELGGEHIVGLVTALQQSVQPQQPAAIDPFAQVEKIMKLAQGFQSLIPAQAQAPADDEESGGLLGGLLGGGGAGKIIETLLMKKLLGDDSGGLLGGLLGGAQSPKQPPQQPTPHQNGPQTPQPSLQHLWHPQEGWIVPRPPPTTVKADPAPVTTPVEPQHMSPQESTSEGTGWVKESPDIGEVVAETDPEQPWSAAEVADEIQNSIANLPDDSAKAKFIAELLENSGLGQFSESLSQVSSMLQADPSIMNDDPVVDNSVVDFSLRTAPGI